MESGNVSPKSTGQVQQQLGTRSTRVSWNMENRSVLSNQIEGLLDQGFNSKLDSYDGAMSISQYEIVGGLVDHTPENMLFGRLWAQKRHHCISCTRYMYTRESNKSVMFASAYQ